MPANQGDPAAPIVVRGRIVDSNGNGVAGAVLQLSVNDFAGAQIGQRVPVVYSGSFSSGPDGSFAIHLAPSIELTAMAQKNGGFVNFELFVSAGNAMPRPWSFPRELKAGIWADEAPVLRFEPDGVTEEAPNVLTDPGVPVPLPAGT